MGVIASQITSLTIVFSIVYLGTDQRKYQSSASLAFMEGIHRGPVNSRHKWPITRKMFPFDDVIMTIGADNDTKPLPAPALNWKLTNIFQWNLNRKYNNYLSGICIWKHRPQNGVHFVQSSKCYVTKRRMVFNLLHSDKILLPNEQTFTFIIKEKKWIWIYIFTKLLLWELKQR